MKILRRRTLRSSISSGSRAASRLYCYQAGAVTRLRYRRCISGPELFAFNSVSRRTYTLFVHTLHCTHTHKLVSRANNPVIVSFTPSPSAFSPSRPFAIVVLPSSIHIYYTLHHGVQRRKCIFTARARTIY